MKEQPSSTNTASRVAADITIKGEIISPNDIRIDGNFEGKLTSNGRVIIGDTARIIGDIICNDIDIWGAINGNIYVRDTFALKEGGNLAGNIQTRRISIELGSKFNGNCQMITEEQFNALTGAPAEE
ncbi:MAG: polymer-forming cytoskeletal protein [Bacteroidales bacterium]|nr:polymer-forming cytoskeletal protein [Candidatus Cryptobacteroides caccocaballi]